MAFFSPCHACVYLQAAPFRYTKCDRWIKKLHYLSIAQRRESWPSNYDPSAIRVAYHANSPRDKIHNTRNCSKLVLVPRSKLHFGGSETHLWTRTSGCWNQIYLSRNSVFYGLSLDEKKWDLSHTGKEKKHHQFLFAHQSIWVAAIKLILWIFSASWCCTFCA